MTFVAGPVSEFWESLKTLRKIYTTVFCKKSWAGPPTVIVDLPLYMLCLSWSSMETLPKTNRKSKITHQINVLVFGNKVSPVMLLAFICGEVNKVFMKGDEPER